MTPLMIIECSNVPNHAKLYYISSVSPSIAKDTV